MATFEINSSDGHSYLIDGSESTTLAQAINYVQANKEALDKAYKEPPGLLARAWNAVTTPSAPAATKPEEPDTTVPLPGPQPETPWSRLVKSTEQQARALNPGASPEDIAQIAGTLGLQAQEPKQTPAQQHAARVQNYQQAGGSPRDAEMSAKFDEELQDKFDALHPGISTPEHGDQTELGLAQAAREQAAVAENPLSPDFAQRHPMLAGYAESSLGALGAMHGLALQVRDLLGMPASSLTADSAEIQKEQSWFTPGGPGQRPLESAADKFGYIMGQGIPLVATATAGMVAAPEAAGPGMALYFGLTGSGGAYQENRSRMPLLEAQGDAIAKGLFQAVAGYVIPATGLSASTVADGLASKFLALAPAQRYSAVERALRYTMVPAGVGAENAVVGAGMQLANNMTDKVTGSAMLQTGHGNQDTAQLLADTPLFAGMTKAATDLAIQTLPFGFMAARHFSPGNKLAAGIDTAVGETGIDTEGTRQAAVAALHSSMAQQEVVPRSEIEAAPDVAAATAAATRSVDQAAAQLGADTGVTTAAYRNAADDVTAQLLAIRPLGVPNGVVAASPDVAGTEARGTEPGADLGAGDAVSSGGDHGGTGGSGNAAGDDGTGAGAAVPVPAARGPELEPRPGEWFSDYARRVNDGAVPLLGTPEYERVKTQFDAGQPEPFDAPTPEIQNQEDATRQYGPGVSFVDHVAPVAPSPLGDVLSLRGPDGGEFKAVVVPENRLPESAPDAKSVTRQTARLFAAMDALNGTQHTFVDKLPGADGMVVNGNQIIVSRNATIDPADVSRHETWHVVETALNGDWAQGGGDGEHPAIQAVHAAITDTLTPKQKAAYVLYYHGGRTPMDLPGAFQFGQRVRGLDTLRLTAEHTDALARWFDQNVAVRELSADTFARVADSPEYWGNVLNRLRANFGESEATSLFGKMFDALTRTLRQYKARLMGENGYQITAFLNNMQATADAMAAAHTEFLSRGREHATQAPENKLTLYPDHRDKELDVLTKSEMLGETPPTEPKTNPETAPVETQKAWADRVRAEAAGVRPDAPQVAQPTAMVPVKFMARTLDGAKAVSGKLYELPGYNGPRLAVATYKQRGREGYRVYLPESGMLLEDSNGVSSLSDTLKAAVQRVATIRGTGTKPKTPAGVPPTEPKTPAAAVGDRVTVQTKTWFDGKPVQGWPDPLYLGTVENLETIAGLTYAKVKYDSGRTERVLLDKLLVAEPTGEPVATEPQKVAQETSAPESAKAAGAGLTEPELGTPRAATSIGEYTPKEEAEMLREDLRKSLLGAKFTKGSFTSTMREGVAPVAGEGWLHGGLIAHTVSPGSHNVSHVGTGLSLITGFGTLADAKLAAARLARAADWTSLKSNDAAGKPEFAKALVIGKAMNSYRTRDPLADPELDTVPGTRAPKIVHGNEYIDRFNAGDFREPTAVSANLAGGPEAEAVAKAATESRWANYNAAVRDFLEGDLSKTKPLIAHATKITLVGDTNIRPQGVPKTIKVAKTLEDYRKALGAVAGKKDIRYYLNGVHMEPENGRMVATDGHRMALVDGAPMTGLPEIPTEGVTDKNGVRTERPIAAAVLGHDGKWIGGMFPDYTRVIPEKPIGTVVTVNAAELGDYARGIRRAQRFVYAAVRDIPSIGIKDESGKTAYFNADYVADMADLFRRMGYNEFSLSADDGKIFATSPDDRVKQVIMALRYDRDTYAPVEYDMQQRRLSVPKTETPAFSLSRDGLNENTSVYEVRDQNGHSVGVRALDNTEARDLKDRGFLLQYDGTVAHRAAPSAEYSLERENEVSAAKNGSRVLDGAELADLRRAAIDLEDPKRGITFRITEDGRAVVTGPARTNIPERFQQFADQNRLSYEVRRGPTTGAQSRAQAPMPDSYRQTGARYVQEIGEPGIDRTDRTRFSLERETPEFKNWFGSSKAVDALGHPLVLYHGTTGDIDQFDPLTLGVTTEAESARSAFFFSTSPKVASGYALLGVGRSTLKQAQLDAVARSSVLSPETQKFVTEQKGRYGATWADLSATSDSLHTGNTPDANVVPVYLNIKNPLVIDYAGKSYREISFDSAIKKAKFLGHDGVVFKNAEDSYHRDYSEISDIYAVFDPRQIKSAIGNNGDYSADPRINYSLERTRTQLADYLQRPKAAISNMTRAVIPMAVGSDEAKAKTTRFANDLRKAAIQWRLFDDVLAQKFSREQQGKMWEAADDENLIRSQGIVDPSRGLRMLDPEERAAVELLHSYGEQLLTRAVGAGMFHGTGVPYWCPRIALMLDAEGNYHRLSGGGSGAVTGANETGRNVNPFSPNLKQRKYLTAAETEAGATELAQAKGGEGAELIRNIRVMPMAMARLERAIAARELINQVKAMGQALGSDLVSDHPGENFEVMRQPAFQIWRPAMVDTESMRVVKDAEGKMIRVNADGVEYPYDTGSHWQMQRDANGAIMYKSEPLYLRRDWVGPMSAVLSPARGPGEGFYQGSMALKAAVMTLQMFSPLLHNVVEYGRALPLLVEKGGPKNWATFGLATYFSGHAARVDNNSARLLEATGYGLVPAAGRGAVQDIFGIAEDPSLKPGRGLFAKAAGGLVGLISEPTGEGVKRAIDSAGHFWHQTLLWDRIADLQMGIYSLMKARLLNDGLSELSAGVVAAHTANRFAGTIAPEYLSHMTRMLLNLSLFSRSFTTGNIGVMKDAVRGLPGNQAALIRLESSELAAKAAVSASKRASIGVMAGDIVMMYVTNSLLQSYFNKDDGFMERAHALAAKYDANPASVLMHPFDSMQALTSGASNEPGKQNRILVKHQDDGTAIYARSSLGKIAEDMIGWMTDPLHTAYNKSSTFVKPTIEIALNDTGYGRQVRSDTSDYSMFVNIGKAIAHFAEAQVPLDVMVSAWDLAHGHGSDMDVKKVVGPLIGITYSKGAPGGPAAGEMYDADRQFTQRKANAMPDVQRALKLGDRDAAREILVSQVGMAESEVGRTLATLENPIYRMRKGAVRQFEKHATPEQRARFEHDREEQE